MEFEPWLIHNTNNRQESTVNIGWVPATTFFAVRKRDQKIIGMIDIRHNLEHDFLAQYGGHIGYSVLPSERGKGYATEILKVGIEYAKSLNIKTLMLSCFSDNIPSIKTILKCGGVLTATKSYTDELFPELFIDNVYPEEKIVNVYWIDIVDKNNSKIKGLKFMCSLITVEDIKKSRDFYENILGQKVEADYGQNVSFGGFSIHLRPHFQMLIDNKEVVVGGNNFELYFECDDLEQMVEKLKAEKVEFIHELCEAPWKQLGLKFYDPDKNIIEIGETMEHLSVRLYQQGNSFDEISQLTGLSREFIEKSVQNKTEK